MWGDKVWAWGAGEKGIKGNGVSVAGSVEKIRHRELRRVTECRRNVVWRSNEEQGD